MRNTQQMKRMKKGIAKDDLKKRIQENFLDCGVEVWDSEFI